MENKHNEVTKKIRETLSELTLPISEENIDSNDSLQKDHAIDSILMMEYMVLLEEKFDIEFDLDFDVNILDIINQTADYLIKRYGDQI